MKNIFIKPVLLLLLLLAVTFSYAQNNFFTDAKETSFFNAKQKRVIIPTKYRAVFLDTLKLTKFLHEVPLEKNIINRNTFPVIKIPLPDGTTQSFHIWESPVMELALAAKFPGIKTYTGQGIEDHRATIKIDWTELGFHVMILSSVTTSVFIDPYAQGNKTGYISYFKSDLKRSETFHELASNISSSLQNRPEDLDYETTELCIGGQLRSYRLAVACTDQYANAATGLSNPTVAQVLSAIVTSVNRVDGVYENELDIHFNLVANEDTIVFVNPATDPFTDNDNPVGLISQSQQIIDSYIGDANYDIGHTFSTGGGGLTLYPNGVAGIVCISGEKASCETGLSDPVGDTYNIDYVSHEIGHEFGAYHSFNSSQVYCGYPGQFSQISNSEPGSGTTIMCYAEGPVASPSALCGTDNLQEHSDPDFNALGFDEITQYIINGTGSNCAVVTNSGNTPPVVNAGSDYTIPLSTPFVLTGSATDVDNDSLTYSWEEVDINGPEGEWNEPSGNAPIFRSFPPITTPSRYFPQISDVINNITTIGEILPSYARILHFRLTVRDNHAGCGGVCNDENIITVDSSGPFTVTYPSAANIVWNTDDSATVTWNIAGTASSPINCSNVIIELSTNGGLTFSDTLLTSTPNTGSTRIYIPNITTDSARVRVMAIGNVFYNISTNNFVIQNPTVSAVCPSANTFITSNISGSAYQWQVNTGNGYTNVANGTNYSGATTDTLHFINTPTSWYGNIYQCQVTGTGTSEAVELKYTDVWTGAVSNAWENSANWGCGSLPDKNIDVIINSGATYYPVLNSNTSVRSISVNPSASLTINPPYNLIVTH